MALPFGRATFLGLEGPKAEVCFRRAGPPGVFSEFGVSGRKMCCGAPEILRSEEGFEARGTREEKCAVVPRKLRRAGHQQGNCMQMPQKAVK